MFRQRSQANGEEAQEEGFDHYFSIGCEAQRQSDTSSPVERHIGIGTVGISDGEEWELPYAAKFVWIHEAGDTCETFRHGNVEVSVEL